MLIKQVLALFAWLCLVFVAQANDIGPQLPSLALDPPPPPSSWSGLYDTGQFTPYAAPGGLTKPNSGIVRASQPLVDHGPPDAAATHSLNYDLGSNFHLHMSIAGGAMAGGVIRH
jgi:hypothetical protein